MEKEFDFKNIGKRMPGKKVTGKKSCPYPDGMIDSLFQMLLYPKQMSILRIVGGPMLINRSNQGFFRTV